MLHSGLLMLHARTDARAAVGLQYNREHTQVQIKELVGNFLEHLVCGACLLLVAKGVPASQIFLP